MLCWSRKHRTPVVPALPPALPGRRRGTSCSRSCSQLQNRQEPGAAGCVCAGEGVEASRAAPITFNAVLVPTSASCHGTSTLGTQRLFLWEAGGFPSNIIKLVFIESVSSGPTVSVEDVPACSSCVLRFSASRVCAGLRNAAPVFPGRASWLSAPRAQAHETT